MADETKLDPQTTAEGEAVLSGAEVSAWQTVPAAQPPQPPPGQIVSPPPQVSNVPPQVSNVPPQGYIAPPPPASASGAAQAGYREVFGGSPTPGYPPPAPGYVPPSGYNTQGAMPPGYVPPSGYVPPQNQYNSPNMADLLAAGVLFGRGRRWQRRPMRLIFWPVVLAVLIGVGALHGCMNLFHW